MATTRNQRKAKAKALARYSAKAATGPVYVSRAAGDVKGARMIDARVIGGKAVPFIREPIKRSLVMNKLTGKMIERRKTYI